MSKVTEYLLADDPVVVAHNGGVGTKAYRMENITAGATAKLMGAGQTLAEGVSIAAAEKSSFTLGGGESIYAAAPAGDAITLRLLEYDPG